MWLFLLQAESGVKCGQASPPSGCLPAHISSTKLPKNEGNPGLHVGVGSVLLGLLLAGRWCGD